MAIKISKVLQEVEERKAAGPPMPKVKSRIHKQRTDEYEGPGLRPPTTVILKPRTSLSPMATEKEQILKDIYDQLAQVKRDRSALASANAPMITRIHEQLKTENKGTADEFMRGNLPMPEIAEHYQRLQALTDRAIRLWDQVRHVEKYGELPGIQEPVRESKDEGALKHRLRILIDAISKTRTKLKVGKAHNPSRIMLWEEKVAMLEIERSEVHRELKQLQLNVRNEQ